MTVKAVSKLVSVSDSLGKRRSICVWVKERKWNV